MANRAKPMSQQEYRRAVEGLMAPLRSGGAMVTIVNVAAVFQPGAGPLIVMGSAWQVEEAMRPSKVRRAVRPMIDYVAECETQEDRAPLRVYIMPSMVTLFAGNATPLLEANTHAEVRRMERATDRAWLTVASMVRDVVAPGAVALEQGARLADFFEDALKQHSALPL